MTIRQTYDLLKTIENDYFPKAIRSFTSLLINFTPDYNNPSTFYQHPTSLYSFYAFFCISTNLLNKAMEPLVSSPYCYIAPFVFGAITQGRPDCPAQIRIERTPAIAALAGGINGVLCCLGYSLLESTTFETGKLLNYEVSALATATVAALAFVPFMSKAMCKIETKILNIYNAITGHLIPAQEHLTM